MIGAILGCIGIITLVSGLWFHSLAIGELNKANALVKRARELVDSTKETQARTEEALRRSYRIHEQIRRESHE